MKNKVVLVFIFSFITRFIYATELRTLEETAWGSGSNNGANKLHKSSVDRPGFVDRPGLFGNRKFLFANISPTEFKKFNLLSKQSYTFNGQILTGDSQSLLIENTFQKGKKITINNFSTGLGMIKNLKAGLWFKNNTGIDNLNFFLNTELAWISIPGKLFSLNKNGNSRLIMAEEKANFTFHLSAGEKLFISKKFDNIIWLYKGTPESDVFWSGSGNMIKAISWEGDLLVVEKSIGKSIFYYEFINSETNEVMQSLRSELVPPGWRISFLNFKKDRNYDYEFQVAGNHTERLFYSNVFKPLNQVLAEKILWLNKIPGNTEARSWFFKKNDAIFYTKGSIVIGPIAENEDYKRKKNIFRKARIFGKQLFYVLGSNLVIMDIFSGVKKIIP
ncbi:hypothetical protein ACFL35_12315 [Candidatus Riflebacteria bacterium]